MLLDATIIAIALLMVAAVMAGMIRSWDFFSDRSFSGIFGVMSTIVFGGALMAAIGLGAIALLVQRHDSKPAERIEIHKVR